METTTTLSFATDKSILPFTRRRSRRGPDAWLTLQSAHGVDLHRDPCNSRRVIRAAKLWITGTRTLSIHPGPPCRQCVASKRTLSSRSTARVGDLVECRCTTKGSHPGLANGSLSIEWTRRSDTRACSAWIRTVVVLLPARRRRTRRRNRFIACNHDHARDCQRTECDSLHT